MDNKKIGLPLGADPNKKPYQLYEDVDYKEFWSGWQQYKLDQAEHAVIQKMLPASGRRLIDIGCGFGRISDCYLERFQQVVMFDGSVPLLQEARQNTAGRAIYVAGDLHHLPFKMTCFDYIIMVRVFHHVTDSEACLSELHRVLSSSGKLVFTYRNKLYLMNVLKWLASQTPDRPFSLEPSGVGTTLISHHPDYVKQLLLQTGYSNFRYQGVGVLDRLANMMGSLGKYCPTGKRLAPLFGRIKIAPWIFCSAEAEDSAPLLTSNSIDELLICLVCNGALLNDSGGYRCQSCGHYYPIIDGILDFRIK